jgi:hypothetical protein
MVKKSVRFILAASMVSIISGCSFFAPSTQSVYINGTPADATVIVNGKEVQVPAELEVPRNENLTIIAFKDGFEPYNKSTGYSLSSIGTLDAIGCWLLLLPGAGLLAPGAWELMENNFYYVLTPVKTDAKPEQSVISR